MAEAESPNPWAAAAAELVAAASAPEEPAPQTEAAQIEPEPAAVSTPPPVETPPVSEPPVSVGKQISALAKQEREARDLAAAAKAKEAALEAREKELSVKLAKSGVEEFRADPVGWLETQGVPREQWVEVAESIYFALAPDKAPPDLRLAQMERKLKRDQDAWKRTQEAERAALEAQRAQESDAAQERAYRMVLSTHVEATPEKYPASKAWFSEDPAAWNETLISTARNLATAAQEAGTTADLSPQKIAEEVENYLASRFARWTPQNSAPTPTPNQAASQSKATPQNSKTPPPREIDNSAEAREARAVAILAERMAATRS